MASFENISKNEVITFRGDKAKWVDFVNKIRKNKKRDKKDVWDVLSNFINSYLQTQ
jgi:hypothetical protein